MTVYEVKIVVETDDGEERERTVRVDCEHEDEAEREAIDSFRDAYQEELSELDEEGKTWLIYAATTSPVKDEKY